MSDHRYATRLVWTGSTGAGYAAYSRDHVAAAPPATEIALTADPHFRGSPGRTNPEQLLVMAASSCQLLSFLAEAALAGVEVLDYVDEATGLMPAGSRPMRITEITLRPTVTVAAGTDPAAVEALVLKGHESCYVANSLSTTVRVHPRVVVARD